MPNEKDKLETCLELIRNNNILVLSTQGEPYPLSSLMTYASSDDASEIYMISRKNSNKWKNIEKNPQVSLLIDDRDGKLEKRQGEIKALTITGIHTPVSSISERADIIELISQKNSNIADLFSGPECEIIRIKAESFQLLDGPDKAFIRTKLKGKPLNGFTS
ncbi:pyridoxamine 5'-phosphate oxidase family protein [Maridesulfovibrio ferrireducens]|uniref:pyridoxamine 5'-phosphate oxidase family protein n=1 Tax=Maridesulfovibrio ferrireducens TaxID=246191 RepID=UPI001A32B74B|nr:pyridoxamine 5'-phosphate oxidase family protein [Maridesulfovibrio ferrireducens]MBI9112989.1 pyridoxamine 5'-phosphate oxidase family protein [Maridesulfovibrio ferrireducens]